MNARRTIGRKIYDLGNGQWDIPALRTALEEVLPANQVFNDYEVIHEFEDLGRRVMLLNGRRLDHVQLILLGIRDVTEQHAAAGGAAGGRGAVPARRRGCARLRDAAAGYRRPRHRAGTSGPSGCWGSPKPRRWARMRHSFSPRKTAPPALPSEEIAEATAKGRAADERWHVRKGGARFWGSGVIERRAKS